MATVKLTNTIRDDILRDMLVHRFRVEADALTADFAALANDVYDDLFTKAEAKTRDALPDGWLPTDHCVTAKFGDTHRGYVQLTFDGSLCSPCGRIATNRESIFRRMTSNLRSGCAKAYPHDHPLASRHEDLDRRHRALLSAIDSAGRSGKAALYSASTIARLKVLWPEVAPFCVAYNDDDRVNLPALPIAALNATFGLPVDAATP